MIVIIIGTLLTLFILLLTSEATIKLSLKANNNIVVLSFKIYIFYPIFGFSKTLVFNKPFLERSTIEKGEKGMKWLEKEDLDHPNTVSLIASIFQYVKTNLYILDISDFRWQTHIGMKDAADTGIAVGSAWTVKYWIVGIIYHHMSNDAIPNVNVTPHFQQKVLQTRLECMFTFSIGKAIKVSVGLISVIRSFNKKHKINTRNETKFV